MEPQNNLSNSLSEKMHNYPLNERPRQSFQLRFEDFGDLPLLVVELINDNL